jgi:hypothetical protein
VNLNKNPFVEPLAEFIRDKLKQQYENQQKHQRGKMPSSSKGEKNEEEMKLLKLVDQVGTFFVILENHHAASDGSSRVSRFGNLDIRHLRDHLGKDRFHVRLCNRGLTVMELLYVVCVIGVSTRQCCRSIVALILI